MTEKYDCGRLVAEQCAVLSLFRKRTSCIMLMHKYVYNSLILTSSLHSLQGYLHLTYTVIPFTMFK